MTMIETSSGIRAYQLLAQYHACKLHLIGLKHSSGRSIIAHIKRTYNYKGTNEKVVAQFEAYLIKEGILKND